MKTAQYKMDSRIGPLYLIASEEALCALYFRPPSGQFLKSLKGDLPEIGILLKTVKQLEEYFAGRRRNFELPLQMIGTEFQKKVWTALAKIPYGKTCSYRDLAKEIKHDKAVRAVGSANGRNPISIIVPCHRVIAADGTLGGYGGGLKNKTELLKLETTLLA